MKMTNDKFHHATSLAGSPFVIWDLSSVILPSLSEAEIDTFV